MRTDTSRCTFPAYMCMVSKGQPHYCIVQFLIVLLEMDKLPIPTVTSMNLFCDKKSMVEKIFSILVWLALNSACSPGFDANIFISKSLIYVESIASEQIGTMCRLMGDDRGKFTHAVIVKFSRPRSSSGCRIVFGFFYWKKNYNKSKNYIMIFFWAACY